MNKYNSHWNILIKKETGYTIDELVERAIPKKLKKYNKDFYECECGTIYKFKDSNFCGYCGQKLEWSE